MFRVTAAPQASKRWSVLLIACLTLGALPAEARRPNRPPTISGIPVTTAVVGTAYAFQPAAMDPEGRRLTFKIANKPSWAVFSSATGLLNGTPAAAGTYPSISIKVSDGNKAAALPPFTITVAAVAPKVNTPPTIAGAPGTSVQAGSNYSFHPSAADLDGDALSFSIVGKPSWATFESTTGVLYGTPLVVDAGTYGGIVISVSDGKASAALPTFTVAVSAPVTNRVPTISGTPVTAAQADRPYAFRAAAADADNDPLTYRITGKPSWATFDASTGTLYGTPTAANVGTYAGIVISVSDGKASASLAAFAVVVAQAPTKSVTLTWTAPTMNTDGSALTDLAGYTVCYGTSSRQYSTSLKLPGAGSSSVVIEGFAPGTYYFTIKSVNNAGVESNFAGEVVAQL